MHRKGWERLNGHLGGIIWFTGLSGSGKSTIARKTESELFNIGIRSIVLDGDELRSGLNRDLGFTLKDREENMRRAAETAAMFLNAGFIVMAAMISPAASLRDLVRSRFSPEDYTEVYVRCPIDICAQRDPKGLYGQARSGKLANFTGIDSIYEPPLYPDLTLDTEHTSLERCVDQLVSYIVNRYKLTAR